MSIHDILSNYAPKQLFASRVETAAELNTLSLDLSKGTTAHIVFQIFNESGDDIDIDSVIIQFSDDEDFGTPANIVDDPLDSDGLSVLGNSILNIYFGAVGSLDVPQNLIDLLPYQIGSINDNFCFVANIVNPVGTKRYCRVQLAISDGPTGFGPLAFGFVGPIRFKLSDGEIAQ